MNARRTMSTVLLAALLLGLPPQAHAGRMLCRMKTPVRTEACSRCDRSSAGDANGWLRAIDCCRVTPGSAAESTPLVPASRVSSSHDPLPAVAQLAVSPSIALDTESATAWTPSTGPPGSERLSRATVLRN